MDSVFSQLHCRKVSFELVNFSTSYAWTTWWDGIKEDMKRFCLSLKESGCTVLKKWRR